MYMFSRVVTIAPGRLRSAQGFIAEVTAHVNENTPFDVSVWNVAFGQPNGTVIWSMQFEDFAAYLDGMVELNASTAYLDKVNSAGDLFAGPAEDSLREAIHTAGEPSGSVAWASVTNAVIAEDYSKALGWSVEMADLAAETTGVATMLLRNVFGEFGGMQWLAGYPDSASVAAAQHAIRDSSEYIARLDASEDYFVPGSGQQGLVRRIM